MDAELTDTPGTSRVLDEGLAVLANGVHHGVPGDAELARHLRHRSGVQPHLPAAGRRCPAREQAPDGQGLGHFRPGAYGPSGLGAAEPALVPHETHRPAEGRQIPVLGRHPLAGGRHNTAADRRRCRLQRNDQLVVGLHRIDHAEAGQAEHHLGHAGSVSHVGDLTFIVAAIEQPQR